MGLLFIFERALAIVALCGAVTYLVPYLLLTFAAKVQDLRKKYNAKWAVVTGASSGIGKAIAEKCASQGINVVVVALPDAVLDETMVHLKKTYPKVQFRKVAVNLSAPEYFDTIIQATKDIPVSLLFNNAGFITTGFFNEVALGRSLANIEVNATCGVKLTHHFSNRMVDEGLKGLICFTSSPAFHLVSPTSALYAATKAFVTMFASAISGELFNKGIDVLVIHPSPITSRFYQGAHKLGAIDFFRKTETTPEALVDVMFASAGRTVIRDQGYFPLMMKLLSSVLDFNLLAYLTCRTAQYTGDFKIAQQKAKKKK